MEPLCRARCLVVLPESGVPGWGRRGGMEATAYCCERRLLRLGPLMPRGNLAHRTALALGLCMHERRRPQG